MHWRTRLDLALDVSLAAECRERPQSFLKGPDQKKKRKRGKNGEPAVKFLSSSDKNQLPHFQINEPGYIDCSAECSQHGSDVTSLTDTQYNALQRVQVLKMYYDFQNLCWLEIKIKYIF